MKLQNRNRAMLLAVAGGYVIYLAYEIMHNGLQGTETTMPIWTCIFFTVLLGGAGIAVLILAWKVYRTKDPEEQEKQEDPNALK